MEGFVQILLALYKDFVTRDELRMHVKDIKTQLDRIESRLNKR